MINVKELRLGNKIVIKGQNENWIDVTVDLSYLCFINEFTDDCKGIPLTEEILLKLGYKLVNTTRHYKSFEGSPYLYLLNSGAVKMSTGIEMYYLHQLQNRVFSLTGQEINTGGL